MKNKMKSILICMLMITSVFGSEIISAATKTGVFESNLIGDRDQPNNNRYQKYQVLEEFSFTHDDVIDKGTVSFDGDSPVNEPLWNNKLNDDVSAVSISANGQYIVVGSGSKVYLFHKNSSTYLWYYDTKHTVDSVSISANGQYIVVGSGSKVYLFHKNSSTYLWYYDTKHTVDSVSISDDGEDIAVGSRGYFNKKGYILRFNKDRNDPNLNYQIEAGDRYWYELITVDMSANGQFMVAGTNKPSNMGTVGGRLYCFNEGDVSPNWTSSAPGAVSISTGGDYIAVATSGVGTFGHVMLFHKDTGVIWNYYNNNRGNFLSISISDDGEYIAAGSTDYKVYFFQKDNRTPLWTYDTDSIIVSVSISDDGYFITAGNQMGKLFFLHRDIIDPIWYYDMTNKPPQKPNKPSGPTSGKPLIKYEYETSTTDPNGDQLYYQFYWDNGIYSRWKGPYNSGATVSVSHRWLKQGTYDIMVRAKDTSNAISSWSDKLSVTIPRIRNIIMQRGSFRINLLQRIFQILQHWESCSSRINNGIIISKGGINPVSFLVTGINSISISGDGEYIATGCTDNKVYFFHNWDEKIDQVLDNNTYENIIPGVHSIIYDPSGDSSYGYLIEGTTNKIGYKVDLDVGIGVSIEAAGGLFGEGTNASLDVDMTHSRSNEFFIEYTLEESLYTPGDGPKYMIGPGHGDTYWIEEWIVNYQLINRTIIFNDDIIHAFPVVKFGIVRQYERFLTVDWINKYYPEPWRSYLLDLDISLDNSISSDELPLVKAGGSYNFVTGPGYTPEKSITTYTSRSKSFGLYVSLAAAETLGFDYEEVSGMAKITMSFDFGAKITAYNIDEEKKTFGFTLLDISQCSDTGYDNISFDCYEDKVFGTYLFITDESLSITSKPYEYWTQKADTITPSVTIWQPLNGSYVQGTQTIEIGGTDADSDLFYQIFIDGDEKYNISTQDNIIYWTWQTTQYSNGPHTITAYVTDTSGNTGEDEITVIVSN